VLDESDGLAVRSTIKVEWIRAVDRASVGSWIAAMPTGRWPEVRQAVVHVLWLEEE
jgi:hypothetical protein